MLGAIGCLLALARWQRAEDVTSLLLATIGLGVAVVALRGLRRPLLFAIAGLLALAIALGVALVEQRAARDLARAGELWALAARNRDVARVGDAIEVARAALLAAVELSVTTGVATLPATRAGEAGLAVFENGHLIDRIGQSRIRLTPGGAGVEFAQREFYSMLVARAERDGRSAVASVLLVAVPPADRFARSLITSTVSPELVPSIRLDRPSVLYVIEPDDPTRRAISGGPEQEAVLVVSAAPRSLDEARLSNLQRARVRTAVPLFFAALCLLVVGWRRPATLGARLATVFALLVALALVPLGSLSNVSPLFNAATYFSPVAGSLTANIAALTLAALLALLALFRVLRSTRFAQSRPLAVAIILGVAGLGPFVLRDLSRGIAFPPSGPSAGLWMAWQLALALAAAGILIAGASAGQIVIGRRRGLPAAIGPVVAAVAAIAAPSLWQAPGAWPVWYLPVWIVAIACLAFVRRGRALVTAVAFVAGCGAVTLTWGATTDTRMALAERDVPRLGGVDSSAFPLLARYAEALARERSAPTRARLLQEYAASELARAGYPARLALWSASSTTPIASIGLTTIVDAGGVQPAMAQAVRGTGQPDLVAADDGAFTILVAAVPFGRDTVATIAVPPRTWLLPPDPFTRLTGLAATPDRAPPYRLTFGALLQGVSDTLSDHIEWERSGSLMMGDARMGTDAERRRAHVEVDLRGFDALIPRGALLVLFDVAIILLIWTASAMADGGLWRWVRQQRVRWRRSYRSRLSIAMLGFFLAPAAAFSMWEAYRLREDDRNARELLVREALRTLDVPAVSSDSPLAGALTADALAGMASDAGGPLFAYRDATLVEASDPILSDLAPFGTLLPRGVPSGLVGDLSRADTANEPIYTQLLTLVSRTALVGFRPTNDPAGAPFVLATAARGDELALDARRADLAILVLLVIVAGALAALWLSGLAARQLARPIGTLRDAALAIAAGRPMPPLDVLPPAEFVPVFGAFARMATDLSSSRAALEEAQRRTAAVLREVASGVVAVRHDGSILLANPRAEQLLGSPLPPGASMRLGVTGEHLGPERRAERDPLDWWVAVVPRIREFLERPDRALDAFDITVPAKSAAQDERQLRASLTRLPGGAVLTLDDVTELATAQRILAWGEMARQVAHEIKNPLTPIRLGVQHLRRAWNDGRADFGTILDTNVARILDEIAHLDEIARAFSRYGSAPAERAPGERTDVAAVARDVVELERMGEGDVRWSLTVLGESITDASTPLPAVHAISRADELKEVLLNLLENARLAEARHVGVTIAVQGAHVHLSVEDDGTGMDPETLPHIFEPRFSTRTSGSGLGLAISRRLLDGWGGTISVTSTLGVGSTLTVALQSA